MRLPMLPMLPTIVVGAAIAAMIALGWWQLTVRLPQKEALLAQLAANPARPPVAFPIVPDERLLFRRAILSCIEVGAITRAGAGAAGYRFIAECRTGAEGPGARVQIGTARDPETKVAWRGGRVSGLIGTAPDARPMIARLFDRTPPALLLVADTPAPGLAANPRPAADAVPNNHFAYAMQWFFFAAVAAVIYLLALRRRAGR